jgi:hypothetical protein
MAETITTPKIVEEITHVRTGPWAVNYQSGIWIIASLAAELKAASTRTNSALYVTHVTMGVLAGTSGIVTDIQLRLADGTGDVVFGPVRLTDKGTTVFSKDFEYPLKITDNKALDLGGTSGGNGYKPACFVYVEGYIGDAPIT